MHRLEFSLPCSKKSLGRARSKTFSFAAVHGFKEQAGEIALATQEALKNVLQHACPADNIMRVELTATDDSLLVEVTDTGRGFDPAAAAAGETPLLASHGRGLTIMKGLMDNLSIESDEEGTLVRMEKRRQPRPGA